MLTLDSTTISAHFCCKECGGLVALVVLPGGDSAYECIAAECGKTVMVDTAAESLQLIEALESGGSVLPAPALPPLEVLQAVAGALATAAQTAGNRRNVAALNKATYHLACGVNVQRAGADLLIPSATSAGQVYRVSATGCTCAAGEKGQPCWHAAIYEVVHTTEERYAVEIRPALVLHNARDLMRDQRIGWSKALSLAAQSVPVAV